MKQIAQHISSEIQKVLTNDSDLKLYQASLNDSKICDMDKNIAGERIKELINRTLAERKFTYDEQELQFMIVTVVSDIFNNRRFSQLTIDEIRWCFYYGVRGELCEYMGINAITFHDWLKHYVEHKKPNINKALSSIKTPLLEEKKHEISEENKQEIIKEYLRHRYDEIKTEGADEFDDFGNVIYKWLYKHKLLPNYTDDEKEFIRNDAEITYLSKIRNNNHDLFLKGRTIQALNVNEIMKSLEKNSDSYHSKAIDVEAKKIVVRLFFKSIIEETNLDAKTAFENAISYKK
jgi:hypothetical protein